jgi:hypothetical protein
VGKEVNGYPVPDSNKTMINVIKEPSDVHKKTIKEEILEKNHWEIHREDTRHGYPKCTRCTQEIARHQK